LKEDSCQGKGEQALAQRRRRTGRVGRVIGHAQGEQDQEGDWT